ncbi:MAG: hypothetical protein FWG45_02320 [Oscillospiraceae bacterium]|nr:hypothetical protein [Oscillospiraceae bacterium]
MLSKFFSKKWEEATAPLRIIEVFIASVGILVIRYSIQDDTETLIVAIIFVMTVEIIFAVIRWRLRKKRIRIVNSIIGFLNNCEPDNYIRTWQAVYDKCGRDKNLRYSLFHNLASAYVDKGDFTTAIKILKDAESELKSPTDKTTLTHAQVLITASLCDTMYLARNVEGTMFYYRQLIWFNNLKAPEYVANMVVRNLMIMNNYFDIENGNYELALNAFIGDFNEARITENLRVMVYSQLSMARIYYKLGDYDNLDRCLDFVAQNGKNTYMAHITYGDYEQLWNRGQL